MGVLYDSINERLAAEAEGRRARHLHDVSSLDYAARYDLLLKGAGRAVNHLVTVMHVKPDVRIERSVIIPPQGSVTKITGENQNPRPDLGRRERWKKRKFLAPEKPIERLADLSDADRLLGTGWSVVPEIKGRTPGANARPSQATGTVVTPDAKFADFSRVQPSFTVEDPLDWYKNVAFPTIVSERCGQLASLIHTHGLPPDMFIDL